MPREAAATPASACPQARQKRLPGAAGSPHAGHTTAGAPHSTPKRSLPPGPRRGPCASPLRTPLNPSAAGQTASADGPFHGDTGVIVAGGRRWPRAPGLLPPWPRRPLRRYGPDRPLPIVRQKTPPAHDAPALPAGPTRVGRSGPPSWPGHGWPPALPLRQGTELATMRIPSNARAWQSYRTYSAGS